MTPGRVRVCITADPALCRAALDALRLLAPTRAGELDAGVDALEQVVAKGARRPAAAYDRRSVRVHMLRGWELGDIDVVTRCGREAQRALRSYGTDDLSKTVLEVTTATCDVLEVTADASQVTCARCLKGLSAPAGGARNNRPETSTDDR